VLEYLHDLHGQNAAIRAGYSAKTARSIASENLTKPNLAAAVAAGMALQAMPASEVLARLAGHARGDMSDFLRVDMEDIIISQVLAFVTEDEAGNAVSLAIAEIKAGGDSDAPDDVDREAAPRRALLITTETVRRAVARLDLMEAGRRGKLNLIKEYTIDKDGKATIKLYDAHAPQALIAKIHGMLVERHELAGKDGAPLFPDFETALEKTYASDNVPTTEPA